MQSNVQPTSYHRLRERCLAASTKEFTARGKSVVRCEHCQLAEFACICSWRPTLDAKSEFVLIMHRNELFKPTNTGRLIADVFSAQTHAFCWSRTEPDSELLSLLNDKNRQCFIVFPADVNENASEPRSIFTQLPASEKLNTFILLDGTWKQSGRMFHLSRWLDDYPCILLSEGNLRGYKVRKSHQESYLSTAEAAALCLIMAGEPSNSTVLQDYFQLFNEHYLATRGCYQPEMNELHTRLAAIACHKPRL